MEIFNRPLSDEITRPKSAYPSKTNPRAKSARRATTSKRRSSPPSLPLPPKDLCRLTIRYLKSSSKADHDRTRSRQQGDEIIIMQQHCGGENLTVFKNFVQPGGTFGFDSQRHSEYPFALAFYINGLIDSRLSVCCEYRHKKNTPLGGPSGSFAIVKIEKGEPCQSCKIRREKRRIKFTYSKEIELIRYRQSVVPNPQNQRRSPSLQRPQSPTPPLDEEKLPKKRRSSKKKVKTHQSTSTRDSPAVPEINEKKAHTQVVTQKSDNKNSDEFQKRPLSSDKSRSSTAVLIRKAPSVIDDEQTKPKVEQKMNRTLSDDDSDNDTKISLSPQTPSSDLDEKKPSPKPIKPISENPDSVPDTGKYSPDFDDASGDEKPTKNSKSNHQLAQTYSSDNHDDSDYPSKSTMKKTISTGSSDNLYDQESSEMFNSKKSQRTSNTIDDEKPTHARQNSSDSTEDFLGIKRSSPTQNPTKTQNFEDDFFQSDNPKNQTNKPSWRDDTFFDTK